MKTVRVIAVALLSFFLASVVSAQDLNSAGSAAPVSTFAELTNLLPAPAEAHASQQIVPMALDQIESEAAANNPEIRSAERRVAIARARTGSAGALEDPTLMYRGWGVPLARPYDYNQAQNMFMYSQGLPGPGKRGLQRQLAAADVNILQSQVEAVKRDVTVRVRKSYYDLLRNADELRIHDDQMALAKQGLQSAQIKYTVGRVPQGDVLKAQIAVTKLIEHLVMLQQDGDMARSSLNTLMGRDPGEPLEVVGQYAAPAHLPSLLDLEKTALSSRPELIAVMLSTQKDETQTALARKAYTPDFMLSGGYGLMPGGDGMRRNTYMGEVSMTLPWLNRKKHDAEIGEAEAMTAADKAEYDAKRAEIFQEIREALIKAQAAQKLANLYRNTLRPQAQATLKAAAAAYQNDKTDFLNLLDAQNTTLDVETSYSRTMSEYEQRIAELERAVGAALPRDPQNTRTTATTGQDKDARASLSATVSKAPTTANHSKTATEDQQ